MRVCALLSLCFAASGQSVRDAKIGKIVSLMDAIHLSLSG